ncbi:S66 peptidase family protein [Streptomyces sp. WI04-05B]|uniref:S66 peptidase family protein n=1 Tax=Streptomyces TaxID=1883 RepID=UPI0029B31AA9|nr:MULTISPECIES: LD-carboxypeptidase [unclassified Streptomyces]MDX2545599.1 LD-carboxypeptidase [Streptomyces sp. WI04-05B]MDX2586559.1 LD-carboxypeptidase [Streptomyces sp. WI04-05A]
MKPLVRPSRLAPGARVAVVAPSGPVREERLQSGLDLLRGWGLDPVVAPHVLDRHGEFDYLAGTDADRAADFQAAWCDPAVDAVLCARGGYGAQRMVDLLDWDALRAAGPKVFVGYSDITALHEAFAVRLGLATLHGPMISAVDFLKNARTQEQLRATLFDPESVRVVTALEGAGALVPGRARGVTLGGCLIMLATERGTPHARPGARGGLVMIEDVGESAYQIDRTLTQLLRTGWLDGVAGIALGSWERCGPYEDLRAVFADRLGGLGVPVVEGFGFGHCDGALTIPFGVAAELDADAGTLTLEEPALR